MNTNPLLHLPYYISFLSLSLSLSLSHLLYKNLIIGRTIVVDQYKSGSELTLPTYSGVYHHLDETLSCHKYDLQSQKPGE